MSDQRGGPRIHIRDEARQAATVAYDMAQGGPHSPADDAALYAAADAAVVRAWQEWIAQSMRLDTPPLPAEIDDMMRIAFDNGADRAAEHIAAALVAEGWTSPAESVRLREQLEAVRAEAGDLVALTLVPVEPFTGPCQHDDCHDEDCVGYGIMDAVSAWSDCNRAVGRIYRVDDTEPRYREPGDTVTVYVKASDRAWFERRFGDEPLPDPSLLASSRETQETSE